MRRDIARLLIGLLLIGSAPGVARACSTFCFESKGQRVFGRNYDWKVDEGLVVVNPRHLTRVAATSDHPAQWTSRYGSVTFNQYGCAFPHGGMNEAGLVVEQMWLDETRYPGPDGRVGLDNLQWIQYQLDNCRTVAEVLASDRDIRIVPNGATIHYLVADAEGGCATVEFLDGAMAAHTGRALPHPVLTNSIWSESVEYLEKSEGHRMTHSTPESAGSLDRFVRAAGMVKTPNRISGASAVDKAFTVLDHVAQGDFTQWRIVYDIGARRVHFRTRRSPSVRWVSLRSLDFSCKRPTALLDIHAPVAGDVAGRFQPYTYEQNRALVQAAYRKTSFTANMPDDVLEAIARYPQGAVCRE